MKKIIFALSVLLVVFYLPANAQSVKYKMLKIDAEFGGFPTGTINSAAMALELHIRTSDEFAVGLREQGSFASQDYFSSCITGDYYIPGWGSENARVFAGGGLGVFTESNKYIFSTGNNVSTSNFGAFPRLGIEIEHLRLSAEYDYTGGDRNYVAIGIGFFLGGGKKK